MIRVQRTVLLPCAADELLELVMDIDRYAELDDKIARVHWCRREGVVTEFRCRPRMAGALLPAVVQCMHLEPGQRVEIALKDSPVNRLARLVAEFRASFSCRAIDSATELTRTLKFRFKPIAAFLGEPVFRRWLPRAVDRELDALRRHVEANCDPPRA